MKQVEESVAKEFATRQVREMAYQFADMYFAFVSELVEQYGEQEATETVTRVLFQRAKERANAMIERASETGIERIPDNIGLVSNVPYLGWVPELGCDHCPYGAAWNKRIEEHPWFRKFASLYCDVTDTTIAEVFTGCYSHRITENVVLGDDGCEREYFLSSDVQNGKYTYDFPSILPVS